MNKSNLELNILIGNGVNLDLLGKREAQHYGNFTLSDLEKKLTDYCRQLNQNYSSHNIKLTFFQSNSESVFLSEVEKPYDGAVLNFGAWTHTSLALSDRLKAIGLPFVETHISNLSSRESFRQHSYFSPISLGVVYGMGVRSYYSALVGLIDILVFPDLSKS